MTRARAILFAVSLALSLMTQPAQSAVRVLIVSGLGGEEGYEQKFQTQAKAVASAASRSGAALKDVVVITGEQARRTALDPELKKFAGAVKNDDQVVIVLIGHGSFDGEEYRFNLPGPDITGREILASSIRCRRADARGECHELQRLGGRTVAQAESRRHHGYQERRRAQRHAVRGILGAGAVVAEADRDKNEIVTAAEAYDYASRKVADNFKSNASLATEHSRLDGKNADRIVVARLGSAALLPSDAQLDAMLKEQGTLETRLDAVKAKKGSVGQDEYYTELETVLLDFARLDKRIDARKTELVGPSAGGSSDAQKNR